MSTAYTQDELLTATSNKLVQIYNRLSPRKLTKWSQAKTLLVERILQLQAQAQAQANEQRKPAKEKAPAAEQGAKKPKGMLLLEILERDGPSSAETLAKALDSTVPSVGCYLNYLRTGKRGYPIVAISKERVDGKWLYSLDEKLADVVARAR